MDTLRNGRWTVPIVAGLLIAAALVAGRLAGMQTAGDLLMVAAAVVAGAPIVITAVRALAARVVGIDLLVSVAAIGAVVIGEYWEAAAVTFLFAIGHALEVATLNRTRSALAELVAVAPDVAIVVRGGEQVEVAAAEVAVGETVLVKNGAKAPVDGRVAAGTGALDEASITGESMPVEKLPGDAVFAGTISRGGFLQVEATGVGADTTLARIIHRVEEAQDAKARTQRFMDRFGAWYTPAIMVLALSVGLATGDVVLGLTLLVIGCPGALVISIPVSIVAGIGRAARDGILIKGGEYLEASARITAVALDKTGTLTAGRPRVTDVVVLDPAADRADVLGWAARAEAGSEHPLARPIIEAARGIGPGDRGPGGSSGEVAARGGEVAATGGARPAGGGEVAASGDAQPAGGDVVAASAGTRLAGGHVEAASGAELSAAATDLADPGLPEETTPVPGKGIIAIVDGRRVLVGNLALLEEEPAPAGTAAPAPSGAGTAAPADTAVVGVVAELAAAGRTPMIVAVDGRVLGVIGVADEVRPDAATMVTELHRAGVRRTVMLTGDAPLVAEAIGRATGIDEVHAGLLPEGKLEVVAALQRDGYTVAMVGDGVNDAPALATADIGVAMGAAGSAVAIETADIALMGDDLRKLPEAISLARRTVRTMRQNIAIALVTVAALLLGVLFGGVTMAIGMLVHEASVLIVIANAMRLLRRKGRRLSPSAPAG